MPSSVWVGGIRTSTTTRSGWCSSTARSSSSASATAATTSKPPSASSLVARPASSDRVLGDHDSHGSSTVIVGRPAGRAVDGQRPVDRRGPLGQAVQPGAAASGAAPPRPSSVTTTTEPVAAALHGDLGAARPWRAWPRWSAPRRRRSRRPPRCSASSARHVDAQPDRQRRPGDDPGQRRVQPAVVEHGRVQAADELAQLGQRRLGLVVRRRRWPAGRARRASVRLARAMPRFIASETSRCWAPSCRSRSIRRRSASAAATMSARLRASDSTRWVSSSARPGPSRARAAASSARGHAARHPGRGEQHRGRQRRRSPARRRPAAAAQRPTAKPAAIGRASQQTATRAPPSAADDQRQQVVAELPPGGWMRHGPSGHAASHPGARAAAPGSRPRGRPGTAAAAGRCRPARTTAPATGTATTTSHVGHGEPTATGGPVDQAPERGRPDHPQPGDDHPAGDAERQPEERVEGRAPAARRPQGAQGTLRRAPAPRGGRRLHPGHGITRNQRRSLHPCGHPSARLRKTPPRGGCPPQRQHAPDPGRCPASSRCHTAPRTHRRGGTR